MLQSTRIFFKKKIFLHVKRSFTLTSRSFRNVRVGNERLDGNGLGLTVVASLLRRRNSFLVACRGPTDAVCRGAGLSHPLMASSGPPDAVELIDATVTRKSHENKQTSHGVEDDVSEGEDHAGCRRRIEKGRNEGEDPRETHNGRHAGVQFQLAQGLLTPGTLMTG